MDTVRITEGCGDIEVTFSTDELDQVSFMSMEDKTLTFAPTYENTVSSTGKSILSTIRPTKIPVKMTVSLPGYDRKAETQFDVVFALTESTDCSADEVTASEPGKLHTIYIGNDDHVQVIETGIYQKVIGCNQMCSINQIDAHGNSVDKTSVYKLNLSSGRMTFMMSDFSGEEVGSIYAVAIRCNNFHTEFRLAVKQDCSTNELSWKSTFDEIYFNPMI